ncbi:ABC transporter permease [Brevibacillus agri]|uniref:ABC transporter permease n=1 Tax=Brevibacillus agri TaxID=51101 RepID=A0A3M8B3E5_9BACL|nr:MULTISPECIES: ABC transporter permease [Brevibacillus]EJL43004.1 ABC-type antimicrobial peptide transport system, permease component [Brevibacillus sp. CF112]MDN4095537.1 ABC transporter permease [Brevibacillus agri]MDR9503868.1 ABC transporter permease [Brevibacillus agri]MED3499937.1 ABC transporter permease [Brevibacillus agri]QAV15600.1 peptide ABC transporter permease [Brevibacillus agri]
MNFMESFYTALEGIWANKMRSCLTMLGIIIGITSVIAVTTLGEGGQKAINDEMEKFGQNTFNVFINWDTKEEIAADDLTIEDAEVLSRISPAIEYIVPYNSNTIELKGPKKEERVNLTASTPDYFAMQKTMKVAKGRLFNSADDKEQRAVVVLEDKLGEKLFGQMNPIGQRVRWGNNSLVVIGTYTEEKFKFDMGAETFGAVVPIRYYHSLQEEPSVQMFMGKAVDKPSVDPAMQQVKQYLTRKHQKQDHYMVRSMQESVDQFNQLTGTLTLIFSVIAGISLVVGGVGVMNIMLVSVTERTREIGIRKALGARRSDILIQFLIESVIVCLIGGLIGVLFGLGIAALIAQFANLPPLLSWNSVFIAFGFSSAIGIFFGLYPANKAAKLDPIEALRYE